MAKRIRRTANEILRVSNGPPSKETWWWNDEIQTIVKVKKENVKQWQRDRNEDNLRKYKQACKESKKADEDFYTRLDSKDGEKNIYRIAKMR